MRASGIFLWSVALAVAFGTMRSFAVTGYVTPTTVAMTFNSANLIDMNARQILIFNGPPNTRTFARTDADLTPASAGTVNVPPGRYLGVDLCYVTTRTVSLNNVAYTGSSQTGGVQNGDTLCSTGLNATDPNALTRNAGTCAPTFLQNYNVGAAGQAQSCFTTTWPVPLCIAPAASQASTCQSGDTLMDPTVTSPDLQMMFDLYNSVAIDTTNIALDPSLTSSNPIATIGKPGAIIHLAYVSAGLQADISLVYDSSKRLVFSYSNANTAPTGVCLGYGQVTVTAVPSGVWLNPFGPTWVMSTNFTSGLTQLATGTGMLTIANPYKNVGQTTNVSCVADSAATPPYLGFTYASGAGAAGSTNYTVTRIVDPNNILGGLCTSSAPGYVSGGTCGAYP